MQSVPEKGRASSSKVLRAGEGLSKEQGREEVCRRVKGVCWRETGWRQEATRFRSISLQLQGGSKARGRARQGEDRDGAENSPASSEGLYSSW